MKIKIIKSREGLPPVGTVLIKAEDGDFKDTLNPLGYIYCLGPVLISLALEAGYAEEVKEQWRAWERMKEGDTYYYLGDDLLVRNHTEARDSIDDRLFNAGNYFHDEATAQRAADRLKEALKEFHRENKINE